MVTDFLAEVAPLRFSLLEAFEERLRDREISVERAMTEFDFQHPRTRVVAKAGDTPGLDGLATNGDGKRIVRRGRSLDDAQEGQPPCGDADESPSIQLHPHSREDSGAALQIELKMRQ